MKLINLTPHTITLVDKAGEILLAVPASGTLARVKANTISVGMVTVKGKEIPLTATAYGEVEGLPAPAPDTIYLVSSLVASRVPERADVMIPNESVRDSEGRIIGCKSLGHV